MLLFLRHSVYKWCHSTSVRQLSMQIQLTTDLRLVHHTLKPGCGPIDYIWTHTRLNWYGCRSLRRQLDKIPAGATHSYCRLTYVLCRPNVISALWLWSIVDWRWLITSVPSVSCFQLRQLRYIIQSLTSDMAKTLVHAFISYRLDYCNSLLCSVADSQLQRLQSVQNAAACTVDDQHSA